MIGLSVLVVEADNYCQVIYIFCQVIYVCLLAADVRLPGTCCSVELLFNSCYGQTKHA